MGWLIVMYLARRTSVSLATIGVYLEMASRMSAVRRSQDAVTIDRALPLDMPIVPI